MTRERNIAHVRQSVHPFPHRSSLRKLNLANFQSRRRTFGSAWETSGGGHVYLPGEAAAASCLIEARTIFNSSWRTVPWNAVPVKNIFFPELVYRLSTPIICDAPRRGPSRRKVEKEIRLHVSRVNFSLAFDALLFRWIFELTPVRSVFLDIFFISVPRNVSVIFLDNVIRDKSNVPKKINSNKLKLNIYTVRNAYFTYK